MKTFRTAIQQRKLALTAELTVKRAFVANDVVSQARRLSEFVDAIQVTDNPFGWTQISAMAAASMILHQGIDAIPILTCRDRNRIALKNDLLGYRALGVGSIILTRGYPMPDVHEIKAKGVFDTTGRELVGMAEEMRQETEGETRRDFYIGTGAQVFRPKEGWKAKSLKARSAAGAQFIQSQLCFNPKILKSYMSTLVGLKLTWDYSVIITLTPLPSAKTARWIKRNMSDTLLPVSVIQRLEQAPDPEAEGVAICAELMQEYAEIPGVSGINLLTTGEADLLFAALEASGLANRQLADNTGPEA